MIQTTSLAGNPENVMSVAEFFYGDVKTIYNQIGKTQEALAEAESASTPYERRATIDYDLGEQRKVYEAAVNLSAAHLETYYPTYIRQAAALALEQGVVISL
jgi:hypothetical protein